MKKIIAFFVPFMMLASLASAQEENTYREYLGSGITKIIINKGWHVRLVPRTDDSTFILATCHNLDILDESNDFDIIDNDSPVITLKNAKDRQLGHQVEIESDFRDVALVLMPGATVYADTLFLNQKKTWIEMKPGSILQVGRMYCMGKVTNSVQLDDATLMVDTLEGGELSVEVKKDGRLSVRNYRQELLHVILLKNHGQSCYQFPDDRLVVKKRDAVVKMDADTVHHIEVEDWDSGIMIPQLNLFVDLGVKFHTTGAGWTPNSGWFATVSGASIGSPYSGFMDFELNMPFIIEYRFSPKWQLTTGVNWRVDYSPLSHKVKVEENGYLQLSDTSSHFSNIAISGYFGIPVELYWHPFSSPRTMYFSADLFAGIRTGSHLLTFGSLSDDNNVLKINSTKTDYLNKFRLELGVSMHQALRSSLNTLRCYINLLPDYRNVPELPKCHTFGLEIFF